MTPPPQQAQLPRLEALLLLLLLALGPLACGAAEPVSGSERPRIGLALSGGGARGAAHIGVLRALEEMRVPVDYIAGTSFGAIIGGLYASGMSPDELHRALQSIDWQAVLRDKSPREQLSFRRKVDDTLFLLDKQAGFDGTEIEFPGGLITGQRLELELKRLTARAVHTTDFDRLPIPFRAVASDIASGEMVVLSQGSLATALRASMAVPGIFSPVELDGRLLVDGGITRNLPVDVVRDMGADIVIAVDISSPLLGRERLDSALAIAYQLTSLLTRRNADEQIKSLTGRDVLLVPDLGEFSAADFERATTLVEDGYRAVRGSVQEFSGLSMSAQRWARYRSARRRPSAQPAAPVIDFVRLENRSRYEDDFLLDRLDVTTGVPLDIDRLEQRISVLYGLDVFERVQYDLVEENDRTGLVVRAEDKPWGPGYLQLGLSYSTDLANDNNLALRLGYVHTPIRHGSGEWRAVAGLGEEPGLLMELYQPVAARSRLYVRPALFYDNRPFNLREEGTTLAQVRASRVGATLGVGLEIATWGQLELAVTTARGETDLRIGDPGRFEEGNFTDGAWRLGLRVDTLDDADFPHRGLFGGIAYAASREALGADQEFDQLLVNTFAALPVGANTVLLGLRYDTTLEGTAPVPDRFRVGGLFELPGFVENELTGQHVAVLRAGYLHALGEVFAAPAWVGGSVQLGNAFDDRSDITIDNSIKSGAIFFGLDTFLGPAFAGYGYAEGGNDSLYLRLGRPF